VIFGPVASRLAPIAGRRQASSRAEDEPQILLAAEPATLGDGGDRHLGLGEQFLRAAEAHSDDFIVDGIAQKAAKAALAPAILLVCKQTMMLSESHLRSHRETQTQSAFPNRYAARRVRHARIEIAIRVDRRGCNDERPTLMVKRLPPGTPAHSRYTCRPVRHNAIDRRASRHQSPD
jgi:hypothetical protein